MNNPEFDPRDPTTWPVVLILPEVAAILRMEEREILKAVRAGSFDPMPMEFVSGMYRWRKIDLIG
jgi:hypothetical protein